jgi:D-alanyl-D-alanine carboxypeptidase
MTVGVIGVRVQRWVKAAVGAGLAASLLAFGAAPAPARGYVGGNVEAPSGPHYHSYARRHRAIAYQTAYAGGPPFSAIVVDANTSRELYGVNEDAPRHPASITKVMTLYLLFEQLDRGAMTLEMQIPISEHAAAQEPSKLGVAAGDSISVEEAIKAIVTRSANDVAVAIAEAVGHDEPTFAQMMTRKAHALGMSRTVYRNASGLPNDEQITTAHDLTILARSLEERFPKYFHYFSTHEFEFDGEVIGNHNHLLGRVDGVDGIKTGYTRASGFNLLTSVHRDGRSLVAVVMGGRTAGQRDRIMESLIEEHVAEASNGGRTAPMIADNESPVRAASPPERPVDPATTLAVAPKRATHVVVADSDPDTAEGDGSDLAAKPTPKVLTPAKPAVSAAPPPRKTPDDPAALGWVKGPDGVPAKPEAARPKEDKGKEETRVVRQDAEAPNSSAHGWIIQIGASDDAAKAGELLARARATHSSGLAAAKPFTEKFVKDGDTFYRARFAGLDAERAGQACKALRHNGFPCFATHLE